MTGAQFTSDVQWAWKSCWPQPMELIGDVGQLDAHFGLFGDCVILGTR
jgi:hypothetical protein